ncbi:MAG: hypothetical protein JWN30_417 [Bacilli bacterium]|nr:hypothetical protein [Bacilli bacterium]
MNNSNWLEVKLPADISLTKKEVFELSHPSGTYEIELFTSHNGECWAIGVPKNDAKFIVYGSPIVGNTKQALEIVIDKISRETTGDSCGFDEAEEDSGDDPDELEHIVDEP